MLGSVTTRGFGSQIPRSMLVAAMSAFVEPLLIRPIADAKAAPLVAIHEDTHRSTAMSAGSTARYRSVGTTSSPMRTSRREIVKVSAGSPPGAIPVRCWAQQMTSSGSSSGMSIHVSWWASSGA